ncbi:MAG: hypothetical protein K0R15_1672 [Clostridiales bacterium]|jgi:uncharacterized membrane protein YczE|nr:hypothetical protein [Clostridiales bacterium]
MIAKYAKKIITLIVGVLIISLGASLTIKAAIGLSAWDAMGVTVSKIIKIKIGTVTIFFNGSCIFVQMLMEKKKFRPIELFQFLNVFLIGTFINMFIYNIFNNWEITYYAVRLLVGVVGFAVCAFGVTIVLESKFIRNPLEGVCLLVAERLQKITMGRFRQLLDIVFIAVVLLLSFVFKEEIAIREGTLICMIIFGPLLDLYKKPVRKIIDKLKI